jgi:GT2 family glycosyltransferase
MPRVSVIIPAYNAEDYLAETLRSVDAQGYRDWEVVVADDASTDGTVEVAEGFGRRFTVLRAESNEGPATARNRAIAASSGELLAFLDSDDLWRRDYLERMVTLHDDGRVRNAQIGIVACDARILGPRGFLRQTCGDLQGYPDAVTLTSLLASNSIYGGALSPRALVDDAGGFCPDLFGTEDYDLWLRLVELGYEVAATREPLAVYRVRAASVSANSARMARSLQLTYRRVLERGQAPPQARRVARRQLRIQQAVEQVGLIRSERREGGHGRARLVRSIPLFLRVAIENPGRWRGGAWLNAGRGSRISRLATQSAPQRSQDHRPYECALARAEPNEVVEPPIAEHPEQPGDGDGRHGVE